MLMPTDKRLPSAEMPVAAWAGVDAGGACTGGGVFAGGGDCGRCALDDASCNVDDEAAAGALGIDGRVAAEAAGCATRAGASGGS
jgi:hypothetical protein